MSKILIAVTFVVLKIHTVNAQQKAIPLCQNLFSNCMYLSVNTAGTKQ